MTSKVGLSARWSRRQLLQVAGGAAAFYAGLQSASAQSYPSRPITLIVPYPAGTATDTTLRAFASDPALIATMKQLDQEFRYRNTEDYQRDVIVQIAEQKRLVAELNLSP